MTLKQKLKQLDYTQDKKDETGVKALIIVFNFLDELEQKLDEEQLIDWLKGQLKDE
jgi:hypothetical protein